ncbi:MAG: hypothetical protein GXO21_08160 [Aquificae bacterium]|nr:hypothetical protein [Aquificota bacterium]
MLTKFKMFLFIFIPILIGLYVRFDDLKIWLKNKHFYFFKDRAIFTGNDSFFFARYAEEYFSGKYKPGEPDFLRNVPDFLPYWDPVPLLSVLSGFISKLQGDYIENISLWLIPILSVLFVIPMVLFFKRIGYPLAGFSGALLTVISLAYLPRTSIGRLDTDSLNLFFPFAIALFLLLFSYERKNIKYLYISLAGILANLYMWWYQQPSLLLAIVISFLIFLTIERKLKFSKDDLIGIGVFLLLANPMNLFKGISNAIYKIQSYVFLAGEKAVQGGFPNIQQWVTELEHYDFSRLGKLIVGNEFLFGLGLFGLLLLIVNKWKPFILLLPFLVLGFIPLIGAMRFSMYLVPFIGIGIGAIFDFLIQKFKEKKALEENNKLNFGLSLISAAIILGLLLYTNKYSFAFVIKPKFPPPLAGDFLSLKEKTEENAWIWTWWSEGYMVEYYGNRGVFVDPGSQFTPKTYFIALSYSIDKPYLAKNTILSIASVGLKGIKEELNKGIPPEKIKENVLKGKYIKDVKNPIYWLFTIRSLAAFDGINKIGTWNFKLQNGLEKQYQYIGRCKNLSRTKILCSVWKIDLKEGIVKAGNKYYPLKAIYFKTSKGEIKKGIYNQKGLNLVLVNSNYGAFGFLMYDQPLRSMFTQMYLLRNFDRENFELVYDNFPFSVLYKVKK